MAGKEGGDCGLHGLVLPQGEALRKDVVERFVCVCGGGGEGKGRGEREGAGRRGRRRIFVNVNLMSSKITKN